MQLIYGTTNQAKISSMQGRLLGIDVEIIGAQQAGIQVPEVEENGSSPLENARIKAHAFYKAAKRPVFSCDSGLYIAELSDERQPGVHVRNVGGKRLTDDEMIAYYAAIAREFGGKVTASYQDAICLMLDENTVFEDFGPRMESSRFYLVDAPHQRRNPGFPLDALSVEIASGSYYYDLPLFAHAKTDPTRAQADPEQKNGFRMFFDRVLRETGQAD